MFLLVHIEGLEHKLVKYMVIAYDKRVRLTNNQLASYALLSLMGSMYLPGLLRALNI